jgi:uncharacterized protein (DUF433 family)
LGSATGKAVVSPPLRAYLPATDHYRSWDMANSGRIILDPAVLGGKPHVRGTRLSADFIIGLMAHGWSEADILREYPGLSRDELAACLAYARDVLRLETIDPSAA